MEGRAREGTVLALCAYSSFAAGDALIKGLGGSLGVFQIGFFATAIGCLVVLAVKPRGESWREALRVRRWWVVQVRAMAGLCASVCGIYAFTRLPLSDAYALIFLSPLIVTILGAAVVKESVGPIGWAACGLGFAGVLLVVRPGFETPQLAHLAAIGVAAAMATGVILLRTVAAGESRTAVLAVLMANATAFYAVAMLLGPGLTVPSGGELARLGAAGLCGAGGQAMLIAAVRKTPANRIAPMQYCQLVWAVAYGALFFAERPDALKIAGLALIAGAGLLSARRGPAADAGVEPTGRSLA